MQGWFSSLTGDLAWDQLVDSMKGAISDRSHVVVAGCAGAVVVFVWINYRVAKWAVGRLDDADQGRSTK